MGNDLVSMYMFESNTMSFNRLWNNTYLPWICIFFFGKEGFLFTWLLLKHLDEPYFPPEMTCVWTAKNNIALDPQKRGGWPFGAQDKPFSFRKRL